MNKQLLLALGAFVFAGFANAQTEVNNQTPMAPTSVDYSVQKRVDHVNNRERGTEFFCEDFSNGYDGNNGFGAWTHSDNGIEDIWRIGDDTETQMSQGQYSGNSGSMNSETADNGYAIFDMDGHNTEFELYPGAPSITGYLNFPTLDMSGLNSVILEWQSYFRYCCFPMSPLTVEVSTDGGDNWTLFDAHGDFTEAANTASQSGAIIKLDISCAAAGQEEVDIRFGYNSDLADIFADFGFAYSTYWWAIDDICIYENPVENDLEIEYVTNGDVWNVWEYRVTPFEQAITEDNGGLLVGTVYRNVGLMDQDSVSITVEILNEDQSEVLSTTTSELFTMVSNTNSDICPQKYQDTTYMETGWVPTEMSDYDRYWVRSTISAVNTEDGTPENNTFEKMIIYSNDIYGHDDQEMLDAQVRPSETSIGSGEYNPTGAGNFYHMANDGTMGYGLLINFGPGSDPGPNFELRCYYYDNTVGIGGSAYDETYYVLAEDWIPQGVQELQVYLPFDEPIEMFEGEAYFVAVVNDFQDVNELAIRTQSNSDSDNSTGVYQLNGNGDMTWFTAQSHSPAVRLVTSERVGLDELALTNGILLEQNVPNPASDVTRINYNLTWAKDVKLEIHDMSGRLIQSFDEGTVAPGNHSVDINLNNYSNGVYYYTLTADDISTTKKMVVAGK